MKDQTIGVVGVGVVGSALINTFEIEKYPVVKYDKYKNLGSIYDVAAYADLIFVCVPTPSHFNGEQDLLALEQTLIALHMFKFQGPVVIKSTVLPGVCDSLQTLCPNLKLVHNPEFLTEKNAYYDFMHQDAIILSAKDEAAGQKVSDFFQSILPDAVIAQYDDFKVTECAKYLHNCFLATKVAFMNQFFDYCLERNIKYADVVTAASTQAKLGSSHLSVPGPDGKRGFGGMCFPKDTAAILDNAPGVLTILAEAVAYNKLIRN